MRVRRIAVLIDGGFFLKRPPKLVPPHFCTTPKQVADSARKLCRRHVHSDFVPAAKLARREGVELLIDPLWQRVSDELIEHVDGIASVFPRPSNEDSTAIAA
jgi:hypothetical protein